MKTVLVIPTLNAAKKGKWQEVLAAVAAQDFLLTRKIIIDTDYKKHPDTINRIGD